MTWIDLALPVMVASLLVMAPGLTVMLAFGARGLRLWGWAGPAGVTVVSIAAVLAPFLHVPWSLLPVMATTLILSACVFAVRILVLRSAKTPFLSKTRTEASPGRWGVVALAIAGALIGAQMLMVVGAPENLSQTFDNVFHLNAIRFAVDNANASPLFIASMTSGGGPAGFYPSGWHAFGSLVVLTTSVSVPVASNAVMIVFAALVWPAAVLLLARELGITSRFGIVAAGATAAAFPAFPLLVVEYGVLYPFMMGVSILPAVLAAVVAFAFPAQKEGRLGPALLIVGFLPGLAVAHPGALVAALAFSLGPLSVAAIRGLSGSTVGRRVFIIGCAVVYAVGFVFAWSVLRPEADARSWKTHETVAQAIGEVIAVAPWYAPVNMLMAILVAAGLYVLLRRRRVTDLSALVVFAIALILYVAVSGLPYPDWRDAIVGPWYNNAPRLAALLPVVWVPLAAWGAELLWGVVHRWQRRRASHVQRANRFAAALAMIVLIVVPQTTSMRQAVESAGELYRFTDDAPLLSSDERALIERLPEHVPDDATIVGSPWTGVALAYALVGRKVLMPHMLTATSEEANLINDELTDATPGSDVCRAVLDLNAGYVLDFGAQEVHYDTHPYAGLTKLRTSEAVELVDSEGSARLYRVVACDHT